MCTALLAPLLFSVCLSFLETLQRYQHYITTGISNSVLSSLPPQQMTKILLLLPPDTERSSTNLPRVKADVQEEAKSDYHLSMKKSIGTETIQFSCIFFSPNSLHMFTLHIVLKVVKNSLHYFLVFCSVMLKMYAQN